MARKSRVTKDSSPAAVPAEKGRAYRTGIYARLSSEDAFEDTLGNQIYLLEQFVEMQEDMILAESYSDNGFSGTNFERPGFERLMEDVKRGRINCIVVKDLSRLGRNYIETGNLIENVFPFLDIRFVAVTDGFDTKNGNGMDGMVASVKNLVNDVYARDISRKIISAFRTKQRNGEYIGMVAPYGYLKSEENKNKFVVDEKTAPVVRKIFRLYLEGRGTDAIARILEGQGIDSPRKYRHCIGVTKSERYKDSKWGRSAVKTILTNRAYVGDMVQGKVKQELCNNVVKQYVDEDEWIVVEGTHDAIISREEFAAVQELLAENSRIQREKREKSHAAEHKEENFLKGYLRCGCCGTGFNLSQTMRDGKMIRVYYCRGYQALRLAFCPNSKRVPKDRMEEAVLRSIRKCAEELLEEWSGRKEETIPVQNDRSRRIRQIDRECASLVKKLADLYQDVSEGILDTEDYLLMRTEFVKRRESLEAEKILLEKEEDKAQNAGDGKSVKEKLEIYCRAEKLDRRLVECFVEIVKIYEEKKIEVNLLDKEEIYRRLEG